LELPGANSSFCVIHIPAMMGLCWKKNIHDTVNQALEDENELQDIETGFGRFIGKEGQISPYQAQIPTLLASIRATGVAHFTQEQIYAETPLYEFLNIIDIPFMIDDDPMIDEPPFSTSAKYFGDILRAAERILGPYKLHSEETDTCVVPFAAVRPFLTQTHTAEPEKQKDNNQVANQNKPVPLREERVAQQVHTKQVQDLIWSQTCDLIF
jgi:hypothetical protein